MTNCLSNLDPFKRAQFATIARLISCLVTESLLPALYWPVSHTNATGFAVILTPDSEVESGRNGLIGKILCIIPLHHPPIFKNEGHIDLGEEISLLDPLDMIPLAFTVGMKSGPEARFSMCSTDLQLKETSSSLVPLLLDVFQSIIGVQLDEDIIYQVNDPLVIWHRFSNNSDVDQNIKEDIADDLASAVKWQSELN
jgi:hypothetical protein